jgi:hypothetical protein
MVIENSNGRQQVSIYINEKKKKPKEIRVGNIKKHKSKTKQVALGLGLFLS